MIITRIKMPENRTYLSTIERMLGDEQTNEELLMYKLYVYLPSA